MLEQNKEQENNLTTQLPPEILLHILSKLKAHELLTVGKVNKALSDLSRDPHLWKALYQEFFDTEPTTAENWLEAFESLVIHPTRYEALLACINGDLEALKKLRLRLTDLKANDYLLVRTALRHRQQKILDHFFDNYFDKNGGLNWIQPNTPKTTIYHLMALCQKNQKIAAIEEAKYEEVHVPDAKNNTPLTLALQHNLSSSFKQLLKIQGADFLKKNGFHLILTKDASSYLSLLLDYQRELWLQESSLPNIVQQKIEDLEKNLFLQSINTNAIKCFKDLGARIYRRLSPEEQSTAIITAIQHNRLAMLKTLLSSLETKQLSTKSRQSLVNAYENYLNMSAEYGNYEISEYLCQSIGKLSQQKTSLKERTLAQRYELLRIAALQGHMNYLKTFFTKGITIAQSQKKKRG